MQVDKNTFDLFEWFGHQIAQNKCDKRIDMAAFLALTRIVTAAILAAWIYMHNDSCSPVFNLHLQCSLHIDGHAGKWNIWPSFMQLTLWAPRQGKWKQTLQMSQSHGRNDLALWLKCFPPLLSDLPLPSINLMMWQKARLIRLNYFCSHLRLTVMHYCPYCSWCRTGQPSVSGYWATEIYLILLYGFIISTKNFFCPSKTNN